MTGILIAVIVLLAVLVVVLLAMPARARRRRHDPTDLLGSALAAREAEHARSAHAAGPPAAGAEALVQQVRLLMGQRKKIHAVKLWREATGVPLAEAVRAVELIAAGGTPGVRPAAGQPAGPPAGPELMANARDLKRQGRLIEAVKLVRRHSGLTLREAKDVVDSL
ncbi:hypothetical protein [Catellatospora sp. NPDC049609]|uniref:hypothetical protein n=1 Tax=Catellatospora sp. NPDC049609 TaxID=3155505 RepID=UPI0034346EFF